MNFFGIIPARYASTRFPGKPLVEIDGKTMIQRVYEQASKVSQLLQVAVATDDQRIFDHVIAFGGKAIMTSSNHQSGTDRCYEAAMKLAVGPDDVVINVQGDEPFISPLQIELVCSCFQDESVQIATLVKPINSLAELENPSSPKVLLDKENNAIYFSRSPIPHYRGREPKDWFREGNYFKHIGIYAYRMKCLKSITALPTGKLESIEALEQLRWLENGFKIRTAITDIESIAIDNPEDLLKLKAR